MQWEEGKKLKMVLEELKVLGMVKSRRIYTALAVWYLGCEEGWRGKGTEIFSNSSGHGITLYKYNYLKSC